MINKSTPLIIVSIILIIGGITSFVLYSENRQNALISNFVECAKAGNPVMESYPAQCRTKDGRHFVQELSEEEKKNLIPPSGQSTISAEEKQAIDNWIMENNLNEYGDQKDTVYAGGNPLFNELTGETTDKYEYIIKKHPDKPWDKN